MDVINIFDSIQGEGKYVGTPAKFIRCAGCNLYCEWCDTKFYDGKQMSVPALAGEILGNSKTVVWTGGEPTLQLDEIVKVIDHLEEGGFGSKGLPNHHLETNATNLSSKLVRFHYVAFSPKDRGDMNRLLDWLESNKVWKFLKYDIKVVTDLENVGLDLIEDATILMPLTTPNKAESDANKKRVWNYCVDNQVKYSPRLQELWGYGVERK